MKVLNVVNSDYKIVVKQDGNIILDTNPEGKSTADGGGGLGTVTITGNLLVQGDTTYINVSDLQVEDNIIIINKNDTGNGVTLGTAGVTVNRGNYTDTSILFDESVSHYNSIGGSTAGTFTFVNDTGALVGIQTCSINTDGKNLYLINAPRPPLVTHPNGPVITVTGTDEYEQDVFDYSDWLQTPPVGPLIIVDPDTIPNVQALSDYTDSSLAFYTGYKIAEDDTVVETIDKDAANFYRTLLNPGYVLPLESKISFRVDSGERGKFTVDGLFVDNVNVLSDTIDNTTNNLKLTATTTNTVEVNAVFQLDNVSSPTAVSGATKVYVQNSDTTPGPGKTGIYFTNLGNSDELVSKNRAVLFSILF